MLECYRVVEGGPRVYCRGLDGRTFRLRRYEFWVVCGDGSPADGVVYSSRDSAEAAARRHQRRESE